MAELRPKEQSEKAESCRENLWNETHFKVLQARNEKGPSLSRVVPARPRVNSTPRHWFPRHDNDRDLA